MRADVGLLGTNPPVPRVPLTFTPSLVCCICASRLEHLQQEVPGEHQSTAEHLVKLFREGFRMEYFPGHHNGSHWVGRGKGR
jgi:hypothetical protein